MLDLSRRCSVINNKNIILIELSWFIKKNLNNYFQVIILFFEVLKCVKSFIFVKCIW